MPLHIKLELIKQFLQALPQDGYYLKFLTMKFPFISHKKLKARISVDPHIKKFMKNKDFEKTMNEIDKHCKSVKMIIFF